MKKIIELGKIAYTGKTKTNLCQIEIEIKTREGIKINWDTLQTVKADSETFTVSGGIWDSKKYDYVSCGQIIDELIEYFPEKIKEIRRLWKKYHLNDLQAGTKKQTEAIELWEAQGNKYDYTKACDYLKSINLFDDRGYKYGHGWLYMPIEPEDLDSINKIVYGNEHQK